MNAKSHTDTAEHMSIVMRLKSVAILFLTYPVDHQVWLRARDVWWLVDSRQLRDGGPGLVGGACQGVDEGGHVHHRTKPSPHILANISDSLKPCNSSQ